MIKIAGSRTAMIFKVAPTHLRHFLPHADDAFGPVQHRVGIAALFGGIDVFISIRSLSMTGKQGFSPLVKPPCGTIASVSARKN
jgi:hypothetical protein